jgi:L-aspartate oxidase
MKCIDTDVLIVGAGLAGLTVALSIQGRKVTVLSSWMPPGGTASAMAQGGIAAAVGEDDSAELHQRDTLQAGAGAGDPAAVRILCEDARSAIDWLEGQGARFDLADGRWALHREAAHSRARVLHINHDRTGFGLTRVLARAARACPSIQLLTGFHAVALAAGEHQVAGLLALDRAGERVRVRARDTVLATGGLGQLFSHTTNPRSACGDGLAMALAAGARTASLEYVQFHPTALAVDADPMPLLTEALRGAGATLVDDDGRDFMREIHASAALAPRDLVAREVWKRLALGQRVFLDARELFARKPEAFPSVRNLCANHHLDPALMPVPVAPAAHYHMGGVAVDLEGRTSLENLWACGEVACAGVHGANRLASNSLLEAVVFGRRLGRALTESRGGAHGPVEAAAYPWREPLSLNVDPILWDRLRRLMWDRAGVLRDEAGLLDASAQLRAMERVVPAGQIQLRFRVRLAAAIVAAALAAKSSRGAHFRADAATTSAPADSDQGARACAGA